MQALDDFILLFTIIDPIGTVPVYLSVVARAPAEMRRRIAIRAVAISAGVLLFFAVAGQFLLETMSIDLSAFRIAGGVVLFLFALDMIFGESKPEHEVHEVEKAIERKEHAEELSEDEVAAAKKRDQEARAAAARKARAEADELAVYPLAIPSIAGPGSLVAIVVLTDNHRYGIVEQAITNTMMLAVLGIVLACLLLANRIQQLIGDAGASIVSRVMGLVIAAIATQTTLDGIKTYFALGAEAAAATGVG